MKLSRSLLFVVIGLLSFSLLCCEDQVLNKEPTEFYSGKDIWNDIELVKRYVNNSYNALEDWSMTSDTRSRITLPASVSDDAYIHFDSGAWITNQGALSPSELGIWAGKWSSDYKYIKKVNEFLNKIGEVKADKSLKEKLKGEMIFIRAWEYAQLLNLFGGVPIIEKTFELHENYNAKRDTYKKGIKWIVGQLDEAKDMVPQTVPSNEWGRVTKGAVLALKSRVLLYAASRLHNSDTEPSGPFYDYNDSNKWEKVADAAKAVINMGQYSLVQVDDWKDYQRMFLHNTPEVIFAKPHSSQFTQGYSNLDFAGSPNGYGGWSTNAPIQNLVDAFQMEDGKSIEKSPLYNPTPDSIYKNRELRFYADIVYQGADYRGREVEFYVPGGLDSKDGPHSANTTETGYTRRKYMDESVDFTSVGPTTPLIYFRLAEIYLNYAEAEYHLGNQGIAREYVNKIRNRVHLPDIHSSGQKLLKDIRHERRIELVYEGYHRFNDLRRWMFAEKQLSENAKGVEWVKVNEQGEQTLGGELTYDIITVQTRNFKKRMYYLPIPRSEIEKTDLQQNWGYK